MNISKNLKSAFADTENLEMTPEIEQEINKIYEEKERFKMKNNNKMIKNIENLQELILSIINLSKKNFLLYVPYLYNIEKVCKMSNEGFERAVEFFSDVSQFIPYLYEIKNEKSFLKETIDNILSNFSKCTQKLESNESSISDYKYYSNKIIYELNKLNCLLEIYYWYCTEYDIDYYWHIADILIGNIKSCIEIINVIKINCLTDDYKDTDIINKDLY